MTILNMKMAINLQKSLLLVLTFLLQTHDLVVTCSESCTFYTNITLCESCNYILKVKETTRSWDLKMCCNGDTVHLTSLKGHSNITTSINELTVVSKNYCNISSFELNIPLLESVNIQHNKISSITFNEQCNTLRIINMSSNRLQSITTGMFNNCYNLTKLLLNRNTIRSILDGSFNGLSSLETLDLSENELSTLPNVFLPLKNLQHLNLSRNNIEFIHENYFNNWLLQHLDVSHNNLKKVAPGALQLLPNLARLLLTDNPHLGITQLDTQLLVGTGRRLQQIDASRTGLYQVPESFTHSVRFLSLIGNKISAIRCGDLDSYPLLQSLDFSDNKIISVEDDSLGRLEMILFLNINKNLLTSVPKTLPDELKYLSLGNNLIKNLTKNDFKNMPNLRILLLQNNQIRFIQNHVFDDVLSLEILDLSNNPIQFLTTSTFEGPLSLKDLRLCFLNISVLENEGNFPMSSPESIQMLHLQSSPSLARQFLMDSAALAAFSHLQYLDLRMNNLSDIRKDLLFYLAQLKTLRLHGNSINCSAQSWLREWMSWNKTLSKNETCYYSTTETKDDDMKYNCTFSETFTINESLPPVNLYSTEMINKLLRYYGYVNNKTERVISKFNDNNTKYEDPKKTKTFSNIKQTKLTNGTILFIKYKNNINGQRTFNDSLLPKTQEVTNLLNRNGINNQNYFDDSMYNIDQNNNNFKHVNFNDNSDASNKLWNSINKKKTGKRLNTPIDTPKSEIIEHFIRNKSVIDNSNTKINSSNSSIKHSEHFNTSDTYSMTKTEFSSYQAISSSYAQYLGTLSVFVLIVTALILWASFRMRYRRRRTQLTDNDSTDQIEVSNISGGVLW